MMEQNGGHNTIIALFLLIGVANCSFTGSYGDVTIECMDKKTTLAVGTTFRIKCSTSGDVKDLLIGKMDTYGGINLDKGTHQGASRRADDLPNTVYNDSKLDEKLTNELAPGRYTIEDHESGKTVVITDAQPEDGGDWVCGTMTMDANDYKSAPYCNVLVVGPVESLVFYNADTFDPIANGGMVVIDHVTKKFNLGLNLTVANVLAHDLPVFAGTRSISDLFLKQGSHGESTIDEGGYYTYIDKMSYKAEIPINGLYKNQLFKARTYIKDFYNAVETNFTLAVEGIPDGVTCSTMSVDESTKEGTLKCEAVVFPKGEVVWNTPRVANVSVGDKPITVGNSTFTNSVDGVKMSSVVTIQDFKDDDYSEYKVKFVNEFGFLEFTSVVSGGNPVAKPMLSWMCFMVLFVAVWY